MMLQNQLSNFFEKTKEALGRFSMPKRYAPLILPVSALLLFLFCFVFTVLVLFPRAELRDRVVGLIHQQTGLHLDIKSLSFSPFLTLEGRHITWQPAIKDLPPVVVDSFSLSPLWTTLFGANPAGLFHASLGRGTADGRCARNGSGKVVLAGVRLGSIMGANFRFPLTGVIGGDIAADRPADLGKGKVSFKLEADDLKIGGLVGLGLAGNELSLGHLQLRGKIMGQTFNLEDLRNDGGELSLAGHGTILINKLPEHCRLNLQIAMRPRAGLSSAAFKQLLLIGGIKAGADGSYRLRLTGTFGRPILR